jgi:hypothetical protein
MIFPWEFALNSIKKQLVREKRISNHQLFLRWLFIAVVDGEK